MLTEEQLGEVVAAVESGSGLRDAIRAVTHQEPSILLITWLRENHYDLLTDAKNGNGHAAAQAAGRQAMKG